jgi:hypothetical protein
MGTRIFMKNVLRDWQHPIGCRERPDRPAELKELLSYCHRTAPLVATTNCEHCCFLPEGHAERCLCAECGKEFTPVDYRRRRKSDKQRVAS